MVARKELRMTRGYRVWDNKNKSYNDPYSYAYYAMTQDGGLDFYCHGDHMKEAEPSMYIVEQYTGLKDKNGKKIYEGDIVKATVRISTPYKSDTFRNVRGKIVYGQGGAFCIEEPEIFTSNNEGSERKFTTINPLFSIGSTDNIEVIGNIHENKELLK